MSAFLLMGSNSKKEPKGTVAVGSALVDRASGIYNEEHFNDLVCLERKRSDRSRKPFLLMLLNLESAIYNGNRGQLVQSIINVLTDYTRETDIRGWYKSDFVIGVLFTELGEATEAVAKASIFNKLYKALGAYLDKDILDNIEVSFLAYPEEDHKQPPNGPPSEDLYPDLVKKSAPTNLFSLVKRFTDIVGSLACLLFFSPCFLVFSILIKRSSKGPVFFRQERIGKFGKKFTCLKFRTMYANNDPSIHKTYVADLITRSPDVIQNTSGGDNGATYKIQGDPRVTSTGRWLRKTSLDELPQFLNVLRGDMSLVGPRPPIAYEVECYEIWHKRRVLEVKPGITGPWQVYGRSRTTFEEMVRMDLRYVRDCSLWLDLKLLLKTPWVVLTGKGGY